MTTPRKSFDILALYKSDYYYYYYYSPDGGRHPSILLCKLLAVIRTTKLTLNDRSKP